MVVIESNSMMHGEENLSNVGTIDTGDLVLVQEIDDIADVVTYTEGFASGHRTYGDYGDVIVYKPDGSEQATPIIHRAMIFLMVNPDGDSYSAESLRDLPAFKWSLSNPMDTWDRLTGTLYLNNVGWQGSSVAINIGGLSAPFRSGFITKGDHNSAIDQPYRSSNVELDWVVGKARGEIPWFGLLKLWSTHTLKSTAPENSVRNLWISIALIVIAPILIDVAVTYRTKKKISEKKDQDKRDGDVDKQTTDGEEKDRR
jgi:signal peptidase